MKFSAIAAELALSTGEVQQIYKSGLYKLRVRLPHATELLHLIAEDLGRERRKRETGKQQCK